jgi:hypothetical protein
MSTKFAAIFAVILLEGFAHAGEGRQTATFHLRASAATVSRWIEEHPDAIQAAGGGEVLATKDDMAKVRMDSPEAGELIFIVRRGGERGHYVETLIKPIRGPMTAHVAEIAVERAIGGSDVTVRMSASVDGLAPIKISVGLRRAIRGMKAELERRFGAE